MYWRPELRRKPARTVPTRAWMRTDRRTDDVENNSGGNCARGTHVGCQRHSTSADRRDYRTYFTFSAPVTLPGVTLPAGRYLFRLADPNTQPQSHQRAERGWQEVRWRCSTRSPTSCRRLRTSRRFASWRPRQHATGHQDLVVPRQVDRIRVHLSEAAGATACQSDARAGADDGAETTDFEKADLARIYGAGVPAVVTVSRNASLQWLRPAERSRVKWWPRRKQRDQLRCAGPAGR